VVEHYEDGLLGPLVVILEGDLEKLVLIALAVVVDGLADTVEVEACGWVEEVVNYWVLSVFAGISNFLPRGPRAYRCRCQSRKAWRTR
jgi:hypothetical protein